MDAIAAKTGMPRSRIEAIIASLLAAGYLREERLQPCAGCPLKRICPFARLRRSIVVYRLVKQPPWCKGG